MNGREHYRESERVLKSTTDLLPEALAAIRQDPRAEAVAILQAQISQGYELAQVHATLALAAFVNKQPGRSFIRVGGDA